MAPRKSGRDDCFALLASLDADNFVLSYQVRLVSADWSRTQREQLARQPSRGTRPKCSLPLPVGGLCTMCHLTFRSVNRRDICVFFVLVEGIEVMEVPLDSAVFFDCRLRRARCKFTGAWVCYTGTK